MESDGKISSSNPSTMVAALLCKRAKVLHELRDIKKQVYDTETSYLQEPSQCGNVVKGFAGFLSSSKSTTLLKRSRKFQPEDRLFSLSSVTSPAAEEHAIGREAGGLSAIGQGKPKRGKGAARDTRRSKQWSEPDFDFEDDPDLMM